MKNLFLFIVLALFAVSCGNQATDSASMDLAEAESYMTVDELKDAFPNMVDSIVVFTGEVDHVCKHGGKRMVVFNPESENSIHVEAGDVGSFAADEVGSRNVVVWGKVEEMRVDDAYIDNLQAELEEVMAKGGDAEQVIEEMDKAKDTEHHGNDAAPHNDQKHKEDIEQRTKQINNLREKLAALKAEGKDYISYYSVICEKYKVVDDAEPAEETDTQENAEEEMNHE
jgi:hypothetical protein